MIPLAIAGVAGLLVVVVVLVAREWRRDNDVPVGSVTWYWNQRRGLHDGIAHAGWCADQTLCEPRELPVNAAGRVLPPRPTFTQE